MTELRPTLLGHGPRQIPRALRMATPQQLWRLNQQGTLVLVVDESSFAPGAPPAHEQIANAHANEVLHRLLEGRWAGLGRWPKAGEAWTVRNGLVVPLEALPDEEARS